MSPVTPSPRIAPTAAARQARAVKRTSSPRSGGLILAGVGRLADHRVHRQPDAVLQLGRRRPAERRAVRADRARLHARLRHHRADQLRPRRPVHARHALRGVHRHRRCSASDRPGPASPAGSSSWSRWSPAWPSARGINVDDRVLRLPPAAPGAQAGAAHHRGRHELHPAVRRPRRGTARSRRAAGRACCRRARSTSAASRIEHKFLVVLAVTIPLLLLMTWIVTRTRAGKAMRATAQDQDAARLMGINVNRIISFTFAIGGALAGAAGLMYQQVDRHDALRPRLPVRPDRLHRGGAGRHRQPAPAPSSAASSSA